MSLYSAGSNCQISQMVRNKQVVSYAPKVMKDVNFPKYSLEPLCILWTAVVHPYCVFLFGVRWCQRIAPNSEPHFSVNFVEVWGMITYSQLWIDLDAVSTVC